MTLVALVTLMTRVTPMTLVTLMTLVTPRTLVTSMTLVAPMTLVNAKGPACSPSKRFLSCPTSSYD